VYGLVLVSVSVSNAKICVDDMLFFLRETVHVINQSRQEYDQVLSSEFKTSMAQHP
jgi:hypothetical protein